jgi:hypothetical protein
MALAVIAGYQYGIARGNYIFAAGAVGLVIIFAIQKVKILKQVNKTSKPKSDKL